MPVQIAVQMMFALDNQSDDGKYRADYWQARMVSRVSFGPGMENIVNEPIQHTLFTRCASTDFGNIIPASGREEFYRRLNNTILDLVRSVPRSVQADAMIFVMSYAGLRIGDELDFFRGYYPPIWSCLYWIVQQCDDDHPAFEMVCRAIEAHGLAMMLHSLDDHLNDGEVPTTHLTLLLRSQAWMLMNGLLNRLSSAVPAGVELVSNFMHEYYAAIGSKVDVEDLAGYCAKIEKQMATGLIVPSILARMAEVQNPLRSGLEAGVRASLVRFGSAWRLLDDIRDLEDDMRSGCRTGVYFALPAEGRLLWDNNESETMKNRIAILINMIYEKDIIGCIIKKIVDELAAAASHADEAGLRGLAAEYHALAQPLCQNNR
jgi:hypothetical protein